MRVLEADFKKGFAKLVPEDADDLWHLYNIISAEDKVYARTTRQVKSRDELGRPRRPERVSIFLGVRVKNVTWDRAFNRLRVHGVVCQAPEDIVGLGLHHTINAKIHEPLTIVKEKWLKHHVERLERAIEIRSPPIVALCVDDEEYCVAILRQYGLEVKAEGTTRLPSKFEAEKRHKAKGEYFKRVLSALREAWMEVKGGIVILGAGYIKDEFANYVKDKDQEIAKVLLDVKGVNNSGVSGINEALRSGVLSESLKRLRIIEETKVVEDVLERLGKGRPVAYGVESVKEAVKRGAVELLAMTDAILRESSDERRLELEEIMRAAEELGGRVMMICAEHEAGGELSSLGGIAAVLRFPLE